ncbi:hypothetical protein Shyhy02_57940 [Streptomyces hygroscopicus subsp. hygroscopicus]|nr:hypothetical protein Shyhy02_57940 [Streptomyces hygroscopicus subsp. hygroscopicus]
MSGGEATGPVPGRGKDRAGRGIPVRPLIFAALMSFGAVRPLSGGGSAPRCWTGDSASRLHHRGRAGPSPHCGEGVIDRPAPVRRGARDRRGAGPAPRAKHSRRP